MTPDQREYLRQVAQDGPTWLRGDWTTKGRAQRELALRGYLTISGEMVSITPTGVAVLQRETER